MEEERKCQTVESSDACVGLLESVRVNVEHSESELESPPKIILEPEVQISEGDPPTNILMKVPPDKEIDLSKIPEVKYSKNGFLVQTGRGSQCKICNATLSSRRTLYIHLQTHAPRRIYCNVCSSSLATVASLKQHLKLHTDQYKCNACSKACSSATDLKRHMEGHSSVKSHYCVVCDKSFLTRAVLKAHAFLHTDRFKCDVCGKRCTTNMGLKKHKDTHFPDIRYPCPICHKTFANDAVLKIHDNLHTGRFQCRVCKQNCITGFALQEHTASKHWNGGRTYTCDSCGKGFRNRSRLQLHLKPSDRYKCVPCKLRQLTRCQYENHECSPVRRRKKGAEIGKSNDGQLP